MDNEFLIKALAGFLDSELRLKVYPSKQRPKLLALFYLASKFEGGRMYSEPEVNEVICAWHTFGNWSMLRRELFNKHFLGRELDGSAYWLEEAQPTLEDFGLE